MTSSALEGGKKRKKVKEVDDSEGEVTLINDSYIANVVF